MFARVRSYRPSHAAVVAYLALFVALGGTSFAALKLPRNSVGSEQIKKDAVTSAKVKNGSLSVRDFARGELPQGATGEKGDTGPPGATGESGARGQAGASAVSLALTRPPIGYPEANTLSYQKLAQVGPWEIGTRCDINSGTRMGFTVKGPGDFQLSGLKAHGDDDATPDRIITGGGLDPDAETLLFSGAWNYAPAFVRFVYSIELRSGTQAATLSLNMIADSRTDHKLCYGSGTAVLSG